jgi:hypothetical protein
MKKLLAAISVLAVAMTSCEKGDKPVSTMPVSTESKFIGAWEAQSFEYIYEYGWLNPEDTTIRIVREEGFESYSADPGELIFDFTSDSLFGYSVYIDDYGSDEVDIFNFVYAWTYSDDTLYLEFTDGPYYESYELQVETVSDTSLVLSYKEYESYNFGDTIEYDEYKETIYFEKINSEDSGCHATGRLIKGDKASFFQGLKKKRNRKR